MPTSAAQLGFLRQGVRLLGPGSLPRLGSFPGEKAPWAATGVHSVPRAPPFSARAAQHLIVSSCFLQCLDYFRKFSNDLNVQRQLLSWPEV